jgi:hypothetical protein
VQRQKIAESQYPIGFTAIFELLVVARKRLSIGWRCQLGLDAAALQRCRCVVAAHHKKSPAVLAGLFIFQRSDQTAA